MLDPYDQDELYQLAIGALHDPSSAYTSQQFTIPEASATPIADDDGGIRARVLQSGVDIDSALEDYRTAVASNPRDQELENLWRDVELRGTKASNEYSWTDALRDATPLVVGSILQATVGKGHGIPEVVQMSLDMADKNAQRKQQKINSERDMAVSARNATMQRGGRALQELNTRISAAEAQGRIPLALGALNARQTRSAMDREKLDMAKRKEDFDQNPNHPSAVAIKEKLVKEGIDPSLVNPLGMAGLNEAAYITQNEYKRHWDGYETSLQVERAGGNAAASTGARIQTEANMAGVSADTARQVSAGSAAGGVEGTAAARAATEYDVPGRTIVDPKVWSSVKTNTSEVAKVRTQAQNRGEMIASLETMLEIRKAEELGTIVPGTRQAEYDTAKTKYMGMAAADMGMGTIQEGDAKRLQQFLPGSFASWTDIFTYLFEDDIKANQLEGVLRAVKNGDVRASAAVGLGAYGSAPTIAGGAPQQPNQGAGVQTLPPRGQPSPGIPLGAGTAPLPSPTRPIPPRGPHGQDLTTEQTETLPSLGVSPLPPLSAVAPAAPQSGMIQVQTPHGPAMITREQYEALKRLGKVQ